MKQLSKYIFISIISLLSLPMLGHLLHVKSFNKKLSGSYIEIKKPNFRAKTFLNEKFQDSASLYLNSKFGFRTELIKINNEIDFRLFNKSNTPNLIVGKENYLFMSPYIRSYFGCNYKGEKFVADFATRLHEVQCKFMADSVVAIFVIAPNKADVYKKYLPNTSFDTCNNFRNQSKLLSVINNDLNIIDVNNWFLNSNQKNLIPKTGIHWSTYGYTLFLDSLLSYMSEKVNKTMPDIIISEIDSTCKAKGSDYDLGYLLNIKSKIKDKILYYPKIRVKNKQKSPDVLVIGDSFYKIIFESGITNSIFGTHDFMYYNKRNLNGEYIDANEHYKNYNFVIFIATEPNLVNKWYGLRD